MLEGKIVKFMERKECNAEGKETNIRIIPYTSMYRK
jgi:hypothetical protein